MLRGFAVLGAFSGFWVLFWGIFGFVSFQLRYWGFLVVFWGAWPLLWLLGILARFVAFLGLAALRFVGFWIGGFGFGITSLLRVWVWVSVV